MDFLEDEVERFEEEEEDKEIVATKIKRTDTSVLILYKFHDVPTNR